jgi:type I restriction enzyme S subunit
MPDEWKSVSLGSVVDAPLELSAPLRADRRPYIALEDMAQGFPRLLGWSYAEKASSAKAVFHRGDILFGKLRPNLKKAVQAPFDGVCSTDVLVLRGRPSEMDQAYLKQLVSWSEFQAWAVSTASGTKMPRTSWKLLRSFRVLLPPILEQRRIASTLSSLDDVIEGTQAVIEEMQVVKKAMLAELLTRGIPGRHVWLRTTELGEMPGDWDIAEGREIFSLTSGYGPVDIHFSVGGEVLFLKVADLNRGENRRGISNAGLRLKERDNPRIRISHPGSIVFAKRGAAISQNRIRLLGVPAIVDPNLMVLSTGPGIDAEFFAYSLEFLGLASLADNSGVPQLNNKHLYPHRFALPPLEEQQEIRVLLSAMDDRLVAEKAHAASLEKLKSALLPALLSGELRVPPDEASP